MALYKSTGILLYGASQKLVLDVDQELVRYYLKLIPRALDVVRGRWGAHVTIVRTGSPFDKPTNTEVWGKYEGEEIDFFYENIVHKGNSYYWLNVFCVRLEEIRSELGLSIESRYTVPPDGFTKCFHITLGNTKHFEEKD